MKQQRLFAILATAMMTVGGVAEAHTGHASAGFASGIAHPFGGLDHLLAMVAVGVLAARYGTRAAWSLPAAFIAMMSVGALAGANGVMLPWVEAAILVSLLVMAALVAAARSLKLPTAVVLVGGLAVFHGHAHGVEMPLAASPLSYIAGFIAATAALHAAGFAMARLAGRVTPRAA